jgi:hypothetical protein
MLPTDNIPLLYSQIMPSLPTARAIKWFPTSSMILTLKLSTTIFAKTENVQHSTLVIPERSYTGILTANFFISTPNPFISHSYSNII